MKRISFHPMSMLLIASYMALAGFAVAMRDWMFAAIFAFVPVLMIGWKTELGRAALWYPFFVFIMIAVSLVSLCSCAWVWLRTRSWTQLKQHYTYWWGVDWAQFKVDYAELRRQWINGVVDPA